MSMDERPVKKQAIQVVFLIDTNQFFEHRGNKNLLNDAFRAISVSILRVLTCLANREDSDRNKFAWGCQFFKIPLNTHFYSRRSVFREFTRNAFEDFEKQLEEEIFVSGKQKSNQKQEGFEVSPAFSLKYALHDASLEFRWDELVLSSPQKVAKHSKRKSSVAEVQNERQTKYVLALLPCPLTSDDLECFCEHRSQFTTSFLKRTLINTGKQDSYLFDSLKASLFWLDSSNLWSVTTTGSASGQGTPGEVLTENYDGYNMINETLALVKGGIISLNCLTNIGLESSSINQLLRIQETFVSHTRASSQTGIKSPSPAEGSRGVLKKTESVLRNSSPSACPALPYSSCLNFFTLCQSSGDSNGILSTTRQDGVIVPLSDLRDMSSGPKCLLKLQTLWKSPEKRMENKGSLKSSSSISLSWCQSDGVQGTAVNFQHDNIRLETEQITNEKTQRSILPGTENTDGNLKAFILAAVPKETLTLDLFQSSQVLSCLGFEVPEDFGSNSSLTRNKLSSSKWFEQMLFHICHKNCLLVLHLSDCFAVLEALTPVIATIRLVHSGKVITLEKSLAFDVVPLFGSDNVKKVHEKSEKKDHSILVGEGMAEMGSLKNKLDIARLREVSDVSPHAKLKDIGKSTVKCNLELNLHRDSKSFKSFSPNCFEPWYRDLPDRGVSAKFLEQLVSLPEYLLLDESVDLDSALCQLKQLYKSEQDLPPSQEKEKECTEESSLTQTTKQNVIQGKSKVILRQYKERTLKMMKSIKRVGSTEPKDSPRKNKISQKEASVQFVPDKEFSSQEDLVAYVQEAYTAAISAASSSLSCAQQIVSLTVHFFKEHCHDNTNSLLAEMVKSFLAKHLFQCNAELIKKYSNPDVVDGKVMRRREAQLQSLLRFELEVAFPTAIDQRGQGKGTSEQVQGRKEAGEVSSPEDHDRDSELPEQVQETVDEISHLLSSIPILGDYEELLTFLDGEVLPSYSDTIPYLVKAVFEELGHPVPDHLMSPASSKPPSIKPPSSYQGIRSWGSMDTVPAASTRSRTWSRHPSLADIGQKRLIMQPKRVITKPVKKPNEAETEARKARRNLFSSDGNKLTRRESVAVMEGISQPRRQSPRKHTQRDRQSKVLKTRVVRETPGKRQVSQALLLQARRARKLEERCIGRSLSPTVEVIEESPVKPMLGSVPRLLHQPPKKQLSFYSESKGKSRQEELQEARHFTARITGSSPVEAADIVKKVQMKKSPARSFLKEVCTPLTLGTLRKMKSGAQNIDLGSSPDLEKTGVDEQDGKREVSIEKVVLSPHGNKVKAETELPSHNTPKKKLCPQSEDDAKENLQKGAESKIRDIPDSNVEREEREFLRSKQEHYPTKRTSLRTSLKRMFDGAAKSSPEAETDKEEEEVKVAGESPKVAADALATSYTGPSDGGGSVGEATIGEQDTPGDVFVTILSGSQEDATVGTPTMKKRKIKSDSSRLQALQPVAKSGPGSRTPSPRRKLSVVLASPEMFKQWPRRKLRSTTPSPKGIFRGQKTKESTKSTGKGFSKTRSPEIQMNENKQSRRQLKTRSKTSLNFKKQSIGDEVDGQLPVPSKNSTEQELERQFSFTSDDDEIEFIKIDRSGSCDSMGRSLSSDGEGCSKDGEKDASSFSPVFSGSQSSAEMTSPPQDQSQFKSPASRTRSKTPAKQQKHEGKSTSPVFSFVSTPSSSGMKLTLRKQYLSPRERQAKTATKSSSTMDRESASTTEDSQSELEGKFSHLSSENDEVFSSLCNDESKQKTLSTPPGSTGKMNCKLSTKGLYDLLHSPFAGSPSHRMKRKQTMSVSRKRTRKVIIQDQVL